MFEIDYEELLENLDRMINQMEFDSMRSAGKARTNAASLVDLYKMKDRYETKLAAAKKAAPKKAATEAAE